MAAEISELKRLLDQSGVRHVDGPRGEILVMVDARPEPVNLVVSRVDDGKLVQLRTVGLLNGPERRYRRVLLKALLEANHRYKVVKFAFDPSDGEVVAYVDVLLGGARMTHTQMERYLRTMRTIVARTRTRAQAIVATGADPGEEQDTDEARAAALLEQLLEMRRRAQAGGATTPSASPPDSPGPKDGRAPGGGGQSDFERLLEDISDDLKRQN